jgi:F-type H+-transporting ATPase subunit epsilon
MFHLQLITLTGTKVDDKAFELTVPTTAGTIVINPGHAPLLGAVAPGVLQIRNNKSDPDSLVKTFGVYSGTVEVLKNEVQVLVDEIDTPEDVVAEEAQKALDRAKKIKAEAKDAVSLAEAQAVIDRQAVRLQLASLKKGSKKRF